MTRELNQLIKKLKTLSPDEIARVQQFMLQVKSPELRAVPVELKAVTGDVGHAAATPLAAAEPKSAHPAASGQGTVVAETSRRESLYDNSNPEAAIAHAACAQWRRRPFQAIDADDLQPIAELFREAVDIRATSRFRYGSR
jgi:hypothetical protein